MLSQAKATYPTLSNRLTCDTLPNLPSVDEAAYDGILCWAVLMHLPEEFLFDRRIQANIERSTSNAEVLPSHIASHNHFDVGRWTLRALTELE